jgi:hypothetical protein
MSSLNTALKIFKKLLDRGQLDLMIINPNPELAATNSAITR